MCPPTLNPNTQELVRVRALARGCAHMRARTDTQRQRARTIHTGSMAGRTVDAWSVEQKIVTFLASHGGDGAAAWRLGGGRAGGATARRLGVGREARRWMR